MVRGLNEGTHLTASLVAHKGWERKKSCRGNGVPRIESSLILKIMINGKRWRMLEILMISNSEFKRHDRKDSGDPGSKNCV